jgi:hypothetical protein
MQRPYFVCSCSIFLFFLFSLLLMDSVAYAVSQFFSPAWCPVRQVSAEACFVAHCYDVHIKFTFSPFFMQGVGRWLPGQATFWQAQQVFAVL